MRLLTFAAGAIVFACAAPAPQPTPASRPLPLSFTPDTQRIERVAEGVTRHFIYSRSGPWAINVLEVDRSACYSAVAAKGYANSIGRKKTSQLLGELDSTGIVMGGVNADFFAPNGRPTNAHISRGIVLTGPSRQPVLAFDSTGRPTVRTIVATAMEADVLSMIDNWNRVVLDGVGFFDARWGPATDSAANAIELVVQGKDMRFVSVDTAVAGVAIPQDGGVVTFRGKALQRGRQYLNADVAPLGWHLLIAARPSVVEAVGGRPALLRDSSVVPEVDTEGAAGFATSRHPRTAVGIAANGNVLLLVTVDGRQKPYSDGMTLRELASLLLAMGARDAINLDGGWSTTLVYKDPATRRLTIANRPSDPTGERAVGNALAIVKGCAAR